MGYYTQYSLSFDESETEVVVELEKYAEEDYGKWCIYGAWVGDLDATKWYDHDKDMKELSKKFPHVLFTLEGEGEESGDIWKKYYKNGKCQRCRAKITFDEYDESKLK